MSKVELAPITSPIAPHHEEPARVIGSVGAFSIVAGSMIGVGIFLFSDEIARGVGSLPMVIAMVLLGGFFALSGSAACGELGAMMPKAGGDYVFQRAAYGRSVAFASGWVLFAAIFAGSTATLAIATTQYQIGPLLGYPAFPNMTEPLLGPFNGAQVGGIGIILLFTLLNDLGTSLSARAQTILTLSPIVLMLGLGGYVLIAQPAVVVPPTGDELGALPEMLTFGGIASAFLAVNFIFSGWINIIYVASEVKEPGKTIPRSMFSATIAVTLLYLVMIAMFVAVLGMSGLASKGSPALGFEQGTRVANALGSPVLGTIVLVTIMLAILTSVNATIMAAARVGYAMSRDGALWKPMGKLSMSGVPRRALWFHALLACLIALTGTADAIGEMTSLAMFVTGSLTVFAMYVLRVKLPDLARPYRANSVMPALYVLLAVFAIAAKLAAAVEEPGVKAWYPLVGLGILAVTWVGHLIYLRQWKSAAVVGVGFLLGGALFDSATRPSALAAVSPTAAFAEAHASIHQESVPAHDVRPLTP